MNLRDFRREAGSLVVTFLPQRGTLPPTVRILDTASGFHVKCPVAELVNLARACEAGADLVVALECAKPGER